MALVVLLRGVNVGGHRTFRPSILAKQLKRFDAINIGAAGTFVVLEKTSRTRLHAELKRRLPFNTEIIICRGSEIVRLVSENPFGHERLGPNTVRFVSILSRRPQQVPILPVTFPPSGTRLLKIIAAKGRFVFGVYRRHMKVIGYLGKIDQLFDVPLTTRNWNTIAQIANVVDGKRYRSDRKQAQR